MRLAERWSGGCCSEASRCGLWRSIAFESGESGPVVEGGSDAPSGTPASANGEGGPDGEGGGDTTSGIPALDADTAGIRNISPLRTY